MFCCVSIDRQYEYETSEYSKENEEQVQCSKEYVEQVNEVMNKKQ